MASWCVPSRCNIERRLETTEGGKYYESPKGESCAIRATTAFLSLSHSLTHSPCFLSDSEQRIKERRKSHRSLEKKIRQRSRIVFSLSSSYFQQFFPLSLPLRRREHLSLERVESRRWHFSSLIREYYPSSPSRETEENPLHARAAGDKRGTNSQ